jgi:citron Rho-interacting kinase
MQRCRPAIRTVHNLRPSLEDFEVIRTIGRGHFGEVKVVKEKSSEDVFALKILRKAEIRSQKTVAFFEEERDILAAGNCFLFIIFSYEYLEVLKILQRRMHDAI